MFLLRVRDLDGSNSLHVRAQLMVNGTSIPIHRDVDELQRISKLVGITGWKKSLTVDFPTPVMPMTL